MAAHPGYQGRTGQRTVGDLVSIIIPAYNREDLLPQTLASAQVQSHDNLEIIVVDDASTDGTEGVVRRAAAIDRRVKYFRNERNSGLCPTRNRGFEESSGEFVMFLDSDDLIEREKVRFQLSLLEGDPALEAVVGQTQWFSLHPRDLQFVWNTFVGPEPIRRMVSEDMMWQSAAPLYRHSALEKFGIYDPDIYTSEDFDLYVRHLAQGINIKMHPHVVVHYRRHGGAQLSNLSDLRRVAYKGPSLHRAFGILRDNGRLDDDLRIRIATSLAYTSYICLESDAADHAMKHLAFASEVVGEERQRRTLEETLPRLSSHSGPPIDAYASIRDSGLDWTPRAPWWMAHLVDNEPLEPLPAGRRYRRSKVETSALG